MKACLKIPYYSQKNFKLPFCEGLRDRVDKRVNGLELRVLDRFWGTTSA